MPHYTITLTGRSALLAIAVCFAVGFMLGREDMPEKDRRCGCGADDHNAKLDEALNLLK